MSEVIRQTTAVTATGCLAGPNLAREIAEGKPAATVIASEDPAVIEAGQSLLRTPRFQVLSSDDLLGIELCGVIKNIMAIAAGAAAGLDLGENARSLLINRGMVEMIHIGRQFGAGIKPFLGAAGMGDLMATCNSPKSRNYTVGFRLAQGEPFEHIRSTMDETAEGINTTRVMFFLSEKYGWKTPITRLVYKVLFEELPVQDAITALMKLPLKEDIDFI
jgi:glycerol-3-phosphate dehydrogenase (NAD(P)+)